MNKFAKYIEDQLYKKASDLVEAVYMQESAALLVSLQEADPRPRVEKDHEGKPVLPTQEQYVTYFQDMQADHIKEALRAAHERWGKLENKGSEVEKQALDLELAVGAEILKQKEAPKVEEGFMDHVRTAAGVMSNNNPMINAVLGSPQKKGKAKKQPIKNPLFHKAVHVASNGNPMLTALAKHLVK